MKYNDIIEEASSELNIDPEYVNKVYKSYWKATRDIINNLPLKEDLNEEDFKKIKTNFNIPSLGKLNCTFKNYKRIKDRYKNAIQIKKELSNED